MKFSPTRLKFLLSFSIFTLLLLLYLLTLVSPGSAEFVIVIVTLALDLALLVSVAIYIRRKAIRELREQEEGSALPIPNWARPGSPETAAKENAASDEDCTPSCKGGTPSGDGLSGESAGGSVSVTEDTSGTEDKTEERL